ncbi:MAG: CPBP family intramembrane metalloprotease [Ruminococcus sp.]|nr:CPBP family intramembrane metalloprotease [Ruminococcus sp.]
MEMNKKKIYLIIVSLTILCFQILYFQLTLVFIQFVMKIITGLSSNCYLMIHHTFQFLLLFIPTILIHKYIPVDFGYHIKDWKKGINWFTIGLMFEIAVAVYVKILYGGSSETFSIDALIFQLFFSGFGEEICYRSLPLVMILWVCGDIEVEIFHKLKIDAAVVLSALFFSIGHISFQFGYSGISYSWMQLIVAFVVGIILGMMYKKTNSIWICMAAHGIYNVIAILS